MPTKAEYETTLADMMEKVTGSVKNKETGEYLKVLRGRRNKNYGNPEMAICVEAFEELKALAPYGWKDKDERTWIPVRLSVWVGEKKEEVKPVDDGTEIPF